jgi:hypothetical protein
MAVHPTAPRTAFFAQFAEAMIEGPYNYSSSPKRRCARARCMSRA